jgi:hypothetical protein
MDAVSPTEVVEHLMIYVRMITGDEREGGGIMT